MPLFPLAFEKCLLLFGETDAKVQIQPCLFPRKATANISGSQCRFYRKYWDYTGVGSNPSPPDTTSSAAGINHRNSQMRLFGFAPAKEKALLGPQ